MALENREAKNERANNLGPLNGIELVLVKLVPAGSPTAAELDVEFFNTNSLDVLLADPRPPHLVFPISGGHRLRAGDADGAVRVQGVSQPVPGSNVLRLTVAPIGDYSTYTLGIDSDPPLLFDPVFEEIEFKFRPGCFNTDCAPTWGKGAPRPDEPLIDYLAKDYDSFRHILNAALEQRLDGFKPTSEADLTQVLVGLLAAAGDELSDFQDRVMNEAYFSRARKRVSLARHARLMDYHIYQGNQASTRLVLELAGGEAFDLPLDFPVWTGGERRSDDAIVFLSAERRRVDFRVNRLSLYTWSDARPALAAGDTSADLAMADQVTADHVTSLIRSGAVSELVIQEQLHPRTGVRQSRDRNKRQLLRLLPGDAGARTLFDPAGAGAHFVRVRWDERDRLQQDYCFTVRLADSGAKVDDVSVFFGNVVPATQGARVDLVYKPPGSVLAAENERYVSPPHSGGTAPVRWGALCELPAEYPVLYRKTEPKNEVPPQSTLQVEVETGSVFVPWQEQIDLVHSDSDARHFLVETDEEGRSTIRFGNGINGGVLPSDRSVRLSYQSGLGAEGNVGAEKLTGFDPAWLTSRGLGVVTRVTNPFDVGDGTAPEPAAQILRNVPEAFRARQLRAITLNDYVKRAEEVPGVSRAAARYAWTGSYRTVRIVIDPVGTEEFDDDLAREVARHLESTRLLGEDLEIRPPHLVPLTIAARVCIDPDFWPEDVRTTLEREFSDGFTADGRPGFFNPDAWTFGQALHLSQIEGRILQVPGVEHVIALDARRFDAATPGSSDQLEMGIDEIVSVRNDPDHRELGTIDFELFGGRA